MDLDARLTAIATSLSIGAATRHVFLCAEQTTPRCSTHAESSAVWKHLKRRLKESGLTSPPPPWQGSPDAGPVEPGTGTVLRTKADCLRICEQGPIAVVYPEGVWYRGVTIPVIDRIVDEHLVGGRLVAEHVFAVAPLGEAP